MSSPRWICLLLFVAAALSLTTAGAEHLVFDSSEECMQSRTVLEGLPSCTNYGDGRWHADHPRDPRSEMISTFWIVVVLWVLFVGVAVALVVSTAREHGDPIGTALFGALVGGPIFLLMYATNSDLIRRSRKLYRWTDRLPENPGAAPAPPNNAARLRELARLKDEGLITGDEYTERRREIIEEV